jgi:hypothetical protein
MIAEDPINTHGQQSPNGSMVLRIPPKSASSETVTQGYIARLPHGFTHVQTVNPR